MVKDTKKQERPPSGEHWCECECANCDIGAHERCSSPKCHMPKWKDRKGQPKAGK